MARREEAFAHDPEGGERGEQAVGMAASQYGAAERGAHTRPAQSRAWALGAVVMTCALVATAHMTQHPTAAAELVARGRKALAEVVRVVAEKEVALEMSPAGKKGEAMVARREAGETAEAVRAAADLVGAAWEGGETVGVGRVAVEAEATEGLSVGARAAAVKEVEARAVAAVAVAWAAARAAAVRAVA